MHPSMLEHAGLIVTTGDPKAARVLEVPWRARLHAPTYGGEWVTLELDVVAVTDDRVLVEQPREGRDAWRAWVPRDAALRVT